MSNIGIDIGTKNIIVSLRKDDKPIFLREINGYYVYPNVSPFIKNMFNDQNKIRSDGTKRPMRYVEYEGRKGLYVLGMDAEELAYAHNDTLNRPMAAGNISREEDAMMVLASIIQGLLDMAEHELGKFDKEVKICYCTTAAPINGQITSVDYHKQVIDLIINSHDSKSKLIPSSITESHAIVIKESPDATGIGISFGAGTITISWIKYGVEVFKFSWIGAGDWIDNQVAIRHGYDPESHRSKSKETPTTVCRIKEKINLTKQPTDRLELDIYLHYKILIGNVIKGIVDGFVENEKNARIDKDVNVYVSGGTASPIGFDKLMSNEFKNINVPFSIGKISVSNNPLFTVAEGCLIASELEIF